MLNDVVFKGQRVLLRRNGSDVAGVVSAEDVALLELLEDQLDLDEVKRRLAENNEPLLYTEARKQLGL